MQWRHQQELAEAARNADIMASEIRQARMCLPHWSSLRTQSPLQAAEVEKQKLIGDLKKQAEVERQRAVAETKKKQW